MRIGVAVLVVVALGLSAGSRARVDAAPAPPMQQKIQMLGPGQCLNCHDHDKEKDWYSSKELLEVVRLFPEKGKNAGHVNSLNQLESPKSDAFAKAIGQADKYDVNGACVRCHATVFNGDANAGVSCESCHGPASAYLTPHQVKGSYDTAVTQYGMTRLVGNIQGWTQQCTNCHVMDDDRLIKAGHPSGDDFDLSKRYLPVSLHFKKSYTPEQVNAIASKEMAAIIYRRRPGSAPPPLVAPDILPVAAGGAAVSLGAPPPPPVAAPVPEPVTTPPSTVAKPAAAPAKPPAPKAPKPAVAKAPAVDVSQPPPGSPTSIEPPPPPPLTPAPAPPTVAPAPPPTPPTPEPAAGLMSGPLPWVGGALVLVALVAVLMMRRKA